jgi:hypothetical protein
MPLGCTRAMLSPFEQRKILKAFKNLSGPEAELLWSILSDHLENERCNCEPAIVNGEEVDADSTPQYKVGEALLNRIETALVEGV